MLVFDVSMSSVVKHPRTLGIFPERFQQQMSLKVSINEISLADETSIYYPVIRFFLYLRQ